MGCKQIFCSVSNCFPCIEWKYVSLERRAGFSAKFSTNRLYNQFAVWVSCAFFLTPTQKLTSLWLENIFVICNDQFARSETTVVWSKLFVWLFVCLFVGSIGNWKSVALQQREKNQFYLLVCWANTNTTRTYMRVFVQFAIQYVYEHGHMPGALYSSVNIVGTPQINDRLSGGQMFLSL